MFLVMLLLTVPALVKGRLFRSQGILMLLVYPSERDPWPFSKALTAVTSSGRDVPSAINVSAITDSGTPRPWAIRMPLSTSSFAPTAIKTAPAPSSPPSFQAEESSSCTAPLDAGAARLLMETPLAPSSAMRP